MGKPDPTESRGSVMIPHTVVKVARHASSQKCITIGITTGCHASQQAAATWQRITEGLRKTTASHQSLCLRSSYLQARQSGSRREGRLGRGGPCSSPQTLRWSLAIAPQLWQGLDLGLFCHLKTALLSGLKAAGCLLWLLHLSCLKPEGRGAGAPSALPTALPPPCSMHTPVRRLRWMPILNPVRAACLCTQLYEAEMFAGS